MGIEVENPLAESTSDLQQSLDILVAFSSVVHTNSGSQDNSGCDDDVRFDAKTGASSRLSSSCMYPSHKARKLNLSVLLCWVYRIRVHCSVNF